MKGIYLSAVATAVGLWCGAASCDVTIRGRVTDSEGKPVCGALVFWVRPAPINSYPESVDGKSEPDGSFELTLAGDRSANDVQSEGVLVYAEGHGLGISTVNAFLKPQADGAPGVVTLPQELSTAFRVVDPEGEPLVGELVEPVQYSFGPGAKLPLSFVQAVGRFTGNDGVAAFPALANDKLRKIRVASASYGTQELDRPSGLPMELRTIQLRRPGRVELRFDSSNGLTMRKCKMLAFTTGTSAAVPGFPGIPGGSLQGAFAEFYDENRGFDIPALAEGTLRFQLSGVRNDEPALPRWPEKTVLKAGETKSFTVSFEKTVTIRGRVLEQGTRRPCSNVDVFVYTRNAGCSILTRTDDEGRYSCNVLEGPVSASATRPLAPGHPSSRSQFLEGVAGPEGYEFPDATIPPLWQPGS